MVFLYSRDHKMDSTFIKDIRQGMKNLCVTFIVLEVGSPIPLKEGREVRTLKVADATACINLSLWDEPGHLLAPGDIVRVTKGFANVWRNALTLYVSKGGDIDKIGEFCMVFNEQVNMSEPNLSFEPNQPGPMMVPAAAINNGNANNGAKMPRLPPPQNIPPPQQQPPQQQNLPKPPQPRFSNEQPNNKPPNNKMNNKPGRGGIRMARPDRR